MQKVWDGSNWVTQNALKVWTGSTWITNLKLKARTSISWLPTAVSDGDISQVVKWSIEAPTPPPPPPPVTHPVPDLDLKTTTELNNILTPLNFGYTIAGYETTSILANDDKVVIDSQIPPAGEALAEFNNVSVKLYNFVQPTTIVPNLGGLLKSAADQAIVQANLVVGSPLDTVETYDSSLVGKVVAGSQFPQAGTEQDQGTSVIYDYYVQKPFVTVPNLVNTDEDDIYTTLSALNLSVGTRTTEATANSALDGKIKSTFPVSGTQVQTNSSVNYTVYVNTLATVPNLVGLTQAQAETALQNANLYSGTITNFETTVVADEGKVRSQGTAAGQTVAKFSGINFVVNVPNTTTTVPNFSLLTTAQADALRISSELNIQLSTSVYTNDTNLQYKIVPNSQSPSAGTVVAIYSTVTMSLYLPFPQYTVPSLIGQTPSSGAIDANFTWGSNSLASTSTQTTSDFGKVASQSPAAGTQAQAQAINYGVYVDGRPTVGNYVGQARTTAVSNIQALGLNASVTYQNQTFNGQATADTVASQSPSSGTRLASGSTVSIVVWNAYVPQPVTRTATVYVGDNAFSGYMRNGVNTSYVGGLLDFTWQAQYKLLNTTGTRVQNIGYQRMSGAYVGYASSTNGKQAYTCRINPTNIDSYIKSNITNNASYTVGNVDFVFSVGNDGNNGKLWYLDWMGNTTSSPSTYTDANRTNTQAVSNINNGDTMSITLNSTMKTYSWTNGYGLGVAAGVTASNASITYGSVNWAYFAANISWTEYV
jgi:beta-lactam-binding protein with PASTA domain